MPIRVALCDDVAELRELFREVLEDAGVEIVGEAEDGAACIELAAKHQPDVLLLDLEAIPHLIARAPDTVIVVLSGFSAGAMAQQALEAGAHSYLEKGAKLTAILDSVRHAAAAPRRSRHYRSGTVNQTRAPGSASSIHSVPP